MWRRTWKFTREPFGRPIAQTLPEEGYPTRHGREWSPWTVRNIVNGAVYKELGQRKQPSQRFSDR